MTSKTGNWQELAAVKRKEQRESIPREWLLDHANLPRPDQVNVIHVARTCGLLTERDLEITENIDVHILLEKIKRGEWSAVEVTRAYYKRAIVAHQVVRLVPLVQISKRSEADLLDLMKTNCLTEIYVEKALAWAKDLDDQLSRTGQVVGPLHGLPISVKDQFCIEGLDTVMGT
jgi:amidase